MSNEQQLRPWAEQPMGIGQSQSYNEDQVAAMFRRVEVSVHFNPERVPCKALVRRPAPSRLRFALAASAVLVLGSTGAVVAAMQMPPLALWLMTVTTPETRNDPVATRAVAPVARPAEPETAVTAAPEPTEAVAEETRVAAPEPVAVRKVARRTRAKSRSLSRRLALATAPAPDLESRPAAPETNPLDQPAPPAPEAPAESPLARENRLLNRAFSQLRSDDPAAALASLNVYQEAHPLGLLSKEATSARVEVLLKLKRTTDALAVLRSYPFGDGARDADLLVVRGELTALKDCQGAIPDFAAVADKAAVPEVIERALYGRAACEVRLDRHTEAVGSLRTYLQRFPDGRFAPGARRQLESLTGKSPAR